MGRTAYGVRGITLRDEDYVVAMETVRPGGALLSVTEHGYGKRTEIEEYRVQSRGGVGVINIAASDRNGEVVGIAYVQENDELLLITQQGMILRMPTNGVRAIGRATQGVRLIDIEADDKVVSVARLVEKGRGSRVTGIAPPMRIAAAAVVVALHSDQLLRRVRTSAARSVLRRLAAARPHRTGALLDRRLRTTHRRHRRRVRRAECDAGATDRRASIIRPSRPGAPANANASSA